MKKLVVFRSQISGEAVKGFEVIGLLGRPGEEIGELYMAIEVDEDIVRSDVSNQVVRVFWEIESEEVFGGEVGVEEIPEFSFGEGQFLSLSMVDFLGQ